MVSIEDDAILEAMKLLATETGVFGEPAGVTAFAGVRVALDDGLIERSASVLHIVTGNGLKDARAAFRAVGEPRMIAPSLDAVREAVSAQAR
jgi:threonine synthase